MSEAEQARQTAYEFYGQGKYELAIEYYTKAIELRDNADDHHERGAANFMSANYADAVKDFSRAMEMRSEENANDYQWRGRAHYLAGNCDAAIEDLTKAMEVRGEDNANDYHWRGEAYYTKGNHDAAAKDTEKALHLNLGSDGAVKLKELSKLKPEHDEEEA